MASNRSFGNHSGNSPNYGSDSTLENSTYLWDKGGGKGRYTSNDIYNDDFDDGGYDDDDD